MVFPKIDPLQFADQGETVWIGTESGGLLALHTPSGKTAQWLPDPTNPSAIPANRVHAVIPAGDGNLWLGTGKGLAYFDKKEDKFTSYRTNDGLIDDRIYCMAFDRNGFLWIGTGNGLSRFDPRTKSFINFTKEDGLVNSEYNRNSAILLEDGTMLMGGMEGIDYFNPNEIEEQLEKPQPMIAHIHNNDKLINRNSQVTFGQEENHFSFYISADPIWMASTLTYQYKLDGAETDWQSLNYSNVVHYPNLPPGNYSFQVKIANQPEIATYEFEIFPIWYRTFWFKICYVLSGFLMIYLLYRMLLARHLYHLNQEKKVLALRAEQALSITKERERIIADLHDDVGATLSSLHIYGDLAGKVWDEQPEKARDMVGKIKAQSKDLMERMNDIVWSMKEQEKDSLSARVRLYATDLLSSKGIYFSDSISPEVEALIREPDMRRSLLLIIKEALNNIAKHSQATVVSLKVYQKKADLIVKIKDNGRGMDLSTAKNGNGLGNIKYRCTKMNGKFIIKSQPGSGTALTCRIPLATISIAPGTNSA
jgi:signal transduction histidine kinase